MKYAGFLICFLMFIQFTNAQDRNIVEINSLHLNDLKYAGFSLRSAKSVHIEAEGAGEKFITDKYPGMMVDPTNMFAYAWIINAKTRELAWRMTLDNTRSDHDTRFNRTFKGDVDLPAGDYEVYFNARKPEYGFSDEGFFSLGNLLNKLLRDKDWFEEDRDAWFIRIEGVNNPVDEEAVNKFHNALRNQAVVSITNLHDSDYRKEGFRLKEPGTFQIYAIGEVFKGAAFDYGWIVNAANSDKVWETLPDKGEYAGGASKNQVWRETITLQPGDYWIYFVMDDSHSPAEWNSNPPYDPDFYGITITGVKGEYDPGSIEKMPELKVKPIVEMTRLGDNQAVNQGFKLSRPMQVRIYALGEGRDGSMFDYGWIVNMDTGEKVWQMDYDRTRNAGGADKNRLIDEVINLPAGSYMVYYVTDNSHSYAEWNSPRPYNPSSWGITVYPADPSYAGERIQTIDKKSFDENVLAQIVEVRDSREIQKRFDLPAKTRIRIYAVGEGDWDEMYDYGWIEDAESGETVWKMRYDETRWAGGARKNRKIDATISLPAGDYLLFFRTDDSHGFGDWNDDPPDDPFHYGITLYQKEE